MDKINDFHQLYEIVLELRSLPDWQKYEKEIEALKDEYINKDSDKEKQRLRRRECEIYLKDREEIERDRKNKEIHQEAKQRQSKYDEERERRMKTKEEEGYKPIKESKQDKSLITLASPNSFNYLTPKMPRFTARQDALIDFIFSKIHKDIPKASKEELSLITQDNYEMVLADRESFPTILTGFKFTTTEVRKKLGIRYSEEEIFEDFKIISDTGIDARGERIWADEKGKYKKEADWRGRIITDIVRTKTTRLAPKTQEPIYEIHLLLGYITGMLWINDSVRKKYCLFSKDFYKLSQQCQKIYRYLSLWLESHIDLDKFVDILGYGSTKNLTEQKKLIEGYLDILKKKGFIYKWERAEGTRGLGTLWHILRDSLK